MENKTMSPPYGNYDAPLVVRLDKRTSVKANYPQPVALSRGPSNESYGVPQELPQELFRKD